MRNSKKLFFLTEAVLVTLVILLSFLMTHESEKKKISVILQDSEDSRWSALKYGLRMAAQDYGVELAIVSAGESLTPEEEREIMEYELLNGADGLIVQPPAGPDAEEMLREMGKRTRLLLIEEGIAKSQEQSGPPAIQPDHYEMGQTLARELLKDFDGKLDGKVLTILSRTSDSEAVRKREQGIRDVLEGTGGRIQRLSLDSIEISGNSYLDKAQEERADILLSVDDSSLKEAGRLGTANSIHGALVYGIGNSTEALYYLDTGVAECLVVPDEFSIGYESMSAIAGEQEERYDMLEDGVVSFSVLRRETLFSKENQEILFTMNQ